MPHKDYLILWHGRESSILWHRGTGERCPCDGEELVFTEDGWGYIVLKQGGQRVRWAKDYLSWSLWQMRAAPHDSFAFTGTELDHRAIWASALTSQKAYHKFDCGEMGHLFLWEFCLPSRERPCTLFFEVNQVRSILALDWATLQEKDQRNKKMSKAWTPLRRRFGLDCSHNLVGNGNMHVSQAALLCLLTSWATHDLETSAGACKLLRFWFRDVLPKEFCALASRGPFFLACRFRVTDGSNADIDIRFQRCHHCDAVGSRVS